MKYGIHGDFEDPPDEQFGTGESGTRLNKGRNDTAAAAAASGIGGGGERRERGRKGVDNNNGITVTTQVSSSSSSTTTTTATTTTTTSSSSTNSTPPSSPPRRSSNSNPSTGPTNNSSKMEAVVFSIQFYGKTIGEVGLLDQDLSELDWKKFKSYIFQNLLSVNNQENICVSYNDDEGDKLPIESEEEYREALKVAKKKAEVHDKLVLDITRQGSLPTVLSLVSSGIKRVSSSPPKEGGMSFFKASSPPKESLGFAGRGLVTERRLLPTFLSSERNDGVGGRGGGRMGGSSSGGARPKEVPVVERQHMEQPPQWFTSYMAKFREEMSQEVANKVAEMLKENYLTLPPPQLPADPHPRVTPPPPFHPVPPPSEQQSDPIDDLQIKFSRCSLMSQGACGMSQANRGSRQASSGSTYSTAETVECDSSRGKKKGKVEVVNVTLKKAGCSSAGDNKGKKKGRVEQSTVVPAQVKKADDKGDTSDPGAKVKKPLTREEERLTKKLEERLVRLGEKFSRIQEKLEEKQIRKHDKIVERLHKQQERLERRKPVSKFPEETDRTSRTQEKVLAKMEGLRKKQSCSPEELNKLRKMVDKQHRVITAEQRQQRRNERKAGNWKAGKMKRVSIDNKAFPVDASLLHAALQELEALAEDSPSEGTHAATQGYDARYVKDITYPDGSEVAPGSEFVKTWRVANTGVWTWNEKTTLCKWTQVRFRDAPAGWKLKPSLKKVVCPPLEPGQEGDISITFTAPSEPGWYATHWRFCQRGRVFGNQMWCAVHVVDNPDANAVLGGSVKVPAGREKKRSEEETERLQTPQKKVVPGDDNTSDSTSGVATLVEEEEEEEASSLVGGVEDREVPSVPTTTTSTTNNQGGVVCVQCEFGIVEDYYDAEDPVPPHHNFPESEECSSAMKPDEALDQEEPDDLDLISFEEDAELVGSGSSTPEMIATPPPPPGAKSVIPLKDIARESVESLREALTVKAGTSVTSGRSVPRPCCVDDMSDSSGSLSEPDSEDQAILNESDTEASDYEYYVVNIPECFDLTHPFAEHEREVALPLPTANKDETDRPDSPDFLTADEDDRATTAAVTSTSSAHTHQQQQQQEPPTAAAPITIRAGDRTGDLTLTLESCSSATNSHPRAVRTVPHTGIPGRASCQTTDGQVKVVTVKSTLPLPPSETKGFMEIPAEALRANLAYSVQQETAATAAPIDGKNSSESTQQQQQDQTRATWKSGAQGLTGVVCEQPLSAQIQCKQDGSSSSSSSKEESAEATTTTAEGGESKAEAGSEVEGTQDAALPDELVSIIPEDLVRGVWNTARTFITRINQEMLSPSGNSPGRIDGEKEEEPAREDRSPPAEEVTGQEEANQNIAATPECDREMPLLPPPLQQLADMGFTNHEVNQRLLTKYNNDVACAVAELIVLNCQ